MTTTIVDPFNAVARVAAGVAWLDEHRPGWHREIDLATLDMLTCEQCVLGQLFGNYTAAPLSNSGGGWSIVAAGMGFTAISPVLDADRDTRAEFVALAGEWRRVIAARRLAADIPAPVGVA